MYEIIRKNLRLSLLTWSDEDDKFMDWMMEHPGQIVLTVVSHCLASINIKRWKRDLIFRVFTNNSTKNWFEHFPIRNH